MKFTDKLNHLMNKQTKEEITVAKLKEEHNSYCSSQMVCWEEVQCEECLWNFIERNYNLTRK